MNEYSYDITLLLNKKQSVYFASAFEIFSMSGSDTPNGILGNIGTDGQ